MAQGKRLTALGIERTKVKSRDQWLSDDEGTRGGGRLAVRISPSGSKLFYFRYSVDGVRKQIPIGQFSLDRVPGCFTLDQAREKAREYGALYRREDSRDVAEYLRGLKEAEEIERQRVADQIAQAQAEAASASKYTLVALCEWYVKYLEGLGKQSAGNVRSLINLHIKGTEWAQLPAKEFTAKQATTMLRRIVERGAGRTAAKVRSVMHSAYNLAVKSETDATAPADLVLFGVEVNPIASTAALSGFSNPRKRSLSNSELGAVWRTLVRSEGESLTVTALRLGLRLGGQRALQLLRARRVEDVNLEMRTITLYDPKGRRKVAREHVLPITKGAMPDVKALLERSKALESPWLFASRKSKLGSESLSTFVRGLSEQFVKDKISEQPFKFSDLRRTVTTMMASLKIREEYRDQIQSHGLSGVELRHYNQYEYMDEKRKALEVWERHLDAVARGEQMPSNVHRMPKRKTA